MIGLEDRRRLVREIEDARAAGARLDRACEVAGITDRMLQRWQVDDVLVTCDRRPAAARPVPVHAVSPEERSAVLQVANEPRFVGLPPARIVPMLADAGTYLASESTIARILREHGQAQHRRRALQGASATIHRKSGMPTKSFAVLVLSCDKYSDVWPAFFKCFRENFPRGAWPIYLGSNTKKCQEPGVITMLSGLDRDWSTSYKRILEQIPQRKLFVILEDLFLSSKISGPVLAELIDFICTDGVNHIRYWGCPKPDRPTNSSLVGECLRGAPYRSTVCGFWDKEYLLRLLIEGEDPWNFEISGSYRTSYSDGFYVTTKAICEYKNMIEKGSWMPASVEWAERNGIPLPLHARPVLIGTKQWKSYLQQKVFDVILRIPWRYRVNLMNRLRKLLISY